MTRPNLPRLLLLASAAALVTVAATALAESRPSPWPTATVIAYKCGDSLCVSDSTSAGQRWLLASNRPWPQWDPAYSPDGREIAFRGYWGSGDGAYALYVAATNGCAAKRLTRGVAGDPSWSPSGDWITFDTSGYGDIYKVHPDGTGLTRLFAGHGVHEGWYPAWSPNGRWIAFVRDRRHGSQIWLMRPDGSDKHILHTDATALDQSLTWSLDGRRLAFDRSPATDQATIALMNANGSDAHTLTSGTPAWNPVWLPNDRGIAYLTAAPLGNGNLGVGHLYAMRANGSGKHALAGPHTIQFTTTPGRLTARRCS